MAKRTWQLEDVEEAARRSATFFIPSRVERCALRVGQQVRLHFMLASPQPGGPRAERMWVEIELVNADGSYRGYLTNQPAAIDGLDRGDLIDFLPHHVAQLFLPKDDPRWYANMERSAVVSESVFEDCCRWVFHQTPDGKHDSGWRLFSGTETQEQLDDPRRIRICNVAWLCDFDPSLAELLKTEVDSAFERGSWDDPWNHVTDWIPPD